ncbi:hypothetical protein HWV62_3915 [Athelia sp. TMB]|nr:hypothetical protein HWV62_3915 [Athelia sp. TMB]
MYRFVISLIWAFTFLGMAVAAPISLSGVLGDLAKRTTYTSTATFFYVGQGACGEWNKDSDHIVALGANHYGSGGHCGQYIYVENTATKKSVYAMVRDECESCGGSDRIGRSGSA